MPNNTKYKYTIYCLQEIEYVGSTRKSINLRMNNHRFQLHDDSTPHYNIPMYKYVRENFPNFNFELTDVIILEEAMLTEEQARAVEQDWIDQLCPSQNSQMAYTGLPKEVYNKQWNARKYTCSCGSIGTINHRNRHEKTKKHKDKIKKIEAQLNEYYKTSEDKHHCTLKHNEKFK